MTALHPELVELETRYNGLIDSVEADHISVDAAMETLRTMLVIDGTGVAWGMSPEGDFVSGEPGGAMARTDPMRFRPAQLPARPGNASSWENSDLMQAPTGDHLHRDGLVGAPSMPTGGFSGGALGTGVMPDNNGGGFDEVAPTKREKAPKAPKAPRAPRNAMGGASALAGRVDVDGIREKLLSNKRNLVVGVLALAAAVMLLLSQFGGSDEGDTTNGVPTASEVAEVTEGASEPTEELPVDGAPAAGGVPNGDEVNTLVTALTSSQRDLVTGAVADSGTAGDVARRTAEFGSYSEEFGLALTSGPVAEGDAGAVSTLTLTDTRTGEAIATGTATFTYDGSSWKLASYPTLG